MLGHFLVPFVRIFLYGFLSVNTLRLTCMCVGLVVERFLAALQYFGLKFWRLWILCAVVAVFSVLLVSLYSLVTTLPQVFGISSQSSPISSLMVSALAWFWLRPADVASPLLAIASHSDPLYFTVPPSLYSKVALATSPCFAVAGRYLYMYGSRVAIGLAARAVS